MRLNTLTLQGFKSFARRDELSFRAPVTAIVGPNGSGKSNIAEAFRFALGEQSPSRLRSRRGEDLIWGGSERVARVNRGTVSVTLDNTSRLLPLGYDEIVVTRVVHRDGQHQYSINGSVVRLKDVHELFAAGNIGPSGHHIIGQGEADRMLQTTPKERRVLVEEALGLKLYRLKKVDAERKLAETNTNIERVSATRREEAPRLKALQAQVKKLARARELRTQLAAMYADYLAREQRYLNATRQALADKRRELTKQRAQLEEQVSIPHAPDSLAAPSADEFAAARAALNAAQEAFDAAHATAAKAEGKLTYYDETAADRSGEATPIPRHEVEDLLTDAEARLSASRETLSQLSRTVDEVIKMFHHFVATRASGTASHAHETRAALVAEVEAAARARDAAQAELTNARAHYEALQKQERRARDATHAAERAAAAAIAERTNVETALAQVSHEETLLERDEARFKEEVQEAVARVGRAAAEYHHHIPRTDAGEEVTGEMMRAAPRAEQHTRVREIERTKIRLEEFEAVDPAAEKEYRDAAARDEFLAKEIKDLEASMQTLRELIADLERTLETEFQKGLEKINTEFARFFTLMFGGGQAKLVAEERDGDADTETPSEPGLTLAVQLPNKRVHSLEVLSGGERSLTSIALVFAMSQVNPPPFLILDETDAALDEANSRRYGDLIEALSQRAQLILITHNRETMRRAHALYGVTMRGDGVSHLLSIQLADAAAHARG